MTGAHVAHVIATSPSSLHGCDFGSGERDRAPVLEDHVRFHVVNPEVGPDSEQAEAVEQLVDLVRSYFR